ncbi:adhesion G protein-coupled receptor E1-like [Paramisgurnus dabryanus]|uniref:adhesion G protein-coupled receptor E1-like n=1 Tax=Paramisgurnus dabryanus TaxID=90735 RepID=UPI0031F3C22B
MVSTVSKGFKTGFTSEQIMSVSPVNDCELYEDTYICTSAQCQLYCNTSVHNFWYSGYLNQITHRCSGYGCDCTGNTSTCTCTSSTSSCFCSNGDNSITISSSVSPRYDCELYSNNTYICTGVHYRMYCDINDHELHFTIDHHHCLKNNCNCYGDKYNCRCYIATSSSCSCENYNNNINNIAIVSPVNNCELYNNPYNCTGVHYSMYSDISQHDFHFEIDHHYRLYNDCTCFVQITCNCYQSRNFTCFCTDSANTTTNTTYPVSTTTNTTCLVNTTPPISPVSTTTTPTSPVSTTPTSHVNTTTNTTSPVSTTTNTTSPVSTTTNTTSHVSTTTNTTSRVNTTTTPTSHVNTTTTPTSHVNTTTNTTSHVSTTTTITSSPTTAALNLTLLNKCTGTECLTTLYDLIENTTVQELPLNNVRDLFDVVFNASEKKMNLSLDDPMQLVQAGNQVLKSSEKLISMLVKETNTSERVSLIRETVEAQVFMVGPQATLKKNSNLTLDKIPQLNTTNASIDIDLIGNALNNKGSAAVAFMSYTTMEDLLKPDFFNKSDDTVNTMMSTVISATLPKTINTNLTKPVNFTLKHIRELNKSGNLSCVYWNVSEWIVDGCSVVKINSSFTVCSCLHLSTFALIMKTSRSPSEEGPLLELVNLVFVIVGLVFTSLALLTFAFCRWKPGVNNVARINLCISLLSAHLLFLLTQQFINLIKPHKELCAVISGVLHFFFLSCFVWMFIEAVLLFICVKNLSKISSKQRAVLNSGFLIVIGYAIAFIIVGVSVGLVPEGYGSEHCWIKQETDFVWSFLGPVCFILVINTILFISIIISLNSTLKNLKAEVSVMKQTKIMVFKSLAQFVILGCPWILGFFINNNQMMEILFLILNSQQGTFIFIIHCFLNDQVRQQYVKWMRAVFP